MNAYDPWAPVYDRWAAHMTDDVPHYVALAREADGPIVELMVGSGRVAIEVVRDTGKPVLGIDSSPAMLEIARGRRDPASLGTLLVAPDNRAVSPPAPAHALFLDRVEYPAALYVTP